MHSDLRIGLTPGSATFGLEGQQTLELQERVVRLYQELREPLLRYLLWLGLPPDQSEEVVQETFLRLYKHLHGGGRDDNLKSWLYRVAHNLALNQHRSRRYIEDASPERWERLIGAAVDPSPNPEDLLLQKEKMRRLHEAIAELSPLQRSCVHLRVAGFRYREVANILGVTIQTVSESLRRAIEKLTRSKE